MRKSLLAGAAVAVVSFGMLGTAAYAQAPQPVPAPTQGKLVTQLNGGTTSAFDNNSAGPDDDTRADRQPDPGHHGDPPECAH